MHPRFILRAPFALSVLAIALTACGGGDSGGGGGFSGSAAAAGNALGSDQTPANTAGKTDAASSGAGIEPSVSYAP
jgi:hypothetical protein